MSDILNDEQLSRRAANAKRLMDDPLYKESFAFVRNFLVESLMNTPEEESQSRERLYLMAKGMEELERFFAVALQEGEVALRQLDLAKKAANQ